MQNSPPKLFIVRCYLNTQHLSWDCGRGVSVRGAYAEVQARMIGRAGAIEAQSCMLLTLNFCMSRACSRPC